jgi:probable DNA repair protein
MPHASHQADWALAQEATTRLLSSADEVIFSFARHAGELEMRPSRLIAQQAGPPTSLPLNLLDLQQPAGTHLPRTEVYEDFSRIAFPPQRIAGGAETLTAQSLCPFQAFATKRLNVPDWEPAEAGLNARQRGQLLHAVLHQVWSGAAQRGISTHTELAALVDDGRLEGFVRRTVSEAMRESFRPGRRSSLPARFPKRLLELEAERLTALVTEWLSYERQRLAFTVAGTERKAEVTVAGLRLNLRLDRVDRMPDGSVMVIDYKSSDVGPAAWRGDRPDDVQLPLYATTAMQEDGLTERVEGLLIAQVRPGEAKLCGRIRNAGETLFHGLTKRDGLIRDPLTGQQMDEWRDLIARLGADFLAGRAEVNPKDPVMTCQRCGLHTICRIQENASLAAHELDEDDAPESSDSGADGRRDA